MSDTEKELKYCAYILYTSEDVPFFVGWGTEDDAYCVLRPTTNLGYQQIVYEHGAENIITRIIDLRDTKISVQYLASHARHILRLLGYSLVNKGAWVQKKGAVKVKTAHRIKPLYRVYYLLDPITGKIIYIGRSKNPSRRKKQHEHRSAKIPDNAVLSKYQQRFEYAEDSKRAEIKAIHKHKPKFNDIHNLKKVGRPKGKKS